MVDLLQEANKYAEMAQILQEAANSGATDDLRQRYRDLTGQDLPTPQSIPSTTPSTDAARQLLEDKVSSLKDSFNSQPVKQRMVRNGIAPIGVGLVLRDALGASVLTAGVASAAVSVAKRENVYQRAASYFNTEGKGLKGLWNKYSHGLEKIIHQNLLGLNNADIKEMLSCFDESGNFTPQAVLDRQPAKGIHLGKINLELPKRGSHHEGEGRAKWLVYQGVRHLVAVDALEASEALSDKEKTHYQQSRQRVGTVVEHLVNQHWSNPDDQQTLFDKVASIVEKDAKVLNVLSITGMAESATLKAIGWSGVGMIGQSVVEKVGQVIGTTLDSPIYKTNIIEATQADSLYARLLHNPNLSSITGVAQAHAARDLGIDNFDPHNANHLKRLHDLLSNPQTAQKFHNIVSGIVASAKRLNPGVFHGDLFEHGVKITFQELVTLPPPTG